MSSNFISMEKLMNWSFTCIISKPIKVRQYGMIVTICDHKYIKHTGLKLT